MTNLRRRPSSVSSAEHARHRDLTKYYQPWLDSKGLNAAPVSVYHGLAVGGDDQPFEPRLSHDANLTALAQLAALRLNVKRGMISLVDTTNQFILAEATQTQSLVDENRHALGDRIWLGGNVALPRQDCICEHVLGAITTCEDGEGGHVDMPALVVNDTLEDERFKNKPVACEKGVRFYAGVPIITKQGHGIGVISVVDERPRPQGLTLDEILFMHDVAVIAVEHLERIMGTAGRILERDFMKGISFFMEDLSEFKYRLSNPDRLSDRSDEQDADLDSMPSPVHQGPLSPVSSPPNGSSDLITPAASGIPRIFEDSAEGCRKAADPSKKNIRRIFTQASKLLCTQAKASGCAFVDATSSLFPTNYTENLTPAGIRVQDVYFDPVTTQDEETSSAGQLHEMADFLSLTLAEGSADSFSQGLITRQSLRRCISKYPFGQTFYLNKGRVMSDKNLSPGEVVTGGGSRHCGYQQPEQESEDRPLQTPLPEEVLERIPDAKWLIFLPLFNYAEAEWFSAGFIWGKDLGFGDPNLALSFIKTFGSCMMSEVTNMEVLNTNIAKSTFIASISHDLRSPLHGLLGNMEFLEDTLTSAYQTSLLGAMETCSKTLLDTIDHLLEHSKINNLNRVMMRRSYTDANGLRQPTSGGAILKAKSTLTTDFDLSLLVEEVVEAVFAGQTFRKTDLRSHDPVDEACDEIRAMELDDTSPIKEQVHSGTAKFSGNVFLIMDIQKTDSWCVEGQTGALRRVIMNVVGNAIKYCKKGWIEISLKMNHMTATDAEVEINVKDTGIGMSQDFIANHLFKPFSQEDPFTPGTGLGLSITSQIVKSLHGRVSIDSEKGVGTHVKIVMPMKRSTQSEGEDDIIVRAAKVAAGRKICILNPPANGFSMNELGSSDGTLSRLTSSIVTLCKDWFDVDIIQSQTVEAEPNTIAYIYAEPPPVESLVEENNKRKELGLPSKTAALLIICTNAFEAAALCAAGVRDLDSLGSVIEVMSQPIGVRKLARVLSQCITRVDEMHQGQSNGSHPSLMNVELAPKVGWNSSSVVYDPTTTAYRPSMDSIRWKSDQPGSKVRSSSESDGISGSLGAKVNNIAPANSLAIPVQNGNEESGSVARRPPRILLVDDNGINLRLLVTFMRKIKLPYAEAVDGLEALTIFKNAKEPFDFVLMDLQMPVMDGLESTKKIREFEKEMGVATPATIIAITGVGNETARKEAIDVGMSEFLTKPVKFKALQQLLIPP
ncbi:hypothetical protein F5Y15DRAFT_406589 [Xylariaceae sp. FL0016]|nr:hypothetical protein F5Y15DRAFT_406589 [Xylariaceae sp. FL0016]